MNRSNKILLIGIIIIFLTAIIGIVYIESTKADTEDYNPLSPKDVVKQFFESWNSKDYPNMYAAVSDEFKKTELTAKNLSSFRAYISSLNISKILIIDIEEVSNNTESAKVSYVIELISKDNVEKRRGEFMLEYKSGDIIPGWKMIQPY